MMTRVTTTAEDSSQIDDLTRLPKHGSVSGNQVYLNLQRPNQTENHPLLLQT